MSKIDPSIFISHKTSDSFEIQEVFDKHVLIAWLEHVAGVGTPITIKLLTGGVHEIESSPHYFSDCETCKEIAAYLARYHEGGE